MSGPSPTGSSPMRGCSARRRRPRRHCAPWRIFRTRRTERVHIEWPMVSSLDRREARLLDRIGAPLPVPVNLTERASNGRQVVAADLNLAPLSAGDYVIELTVGSGPATETRLLAIRVVP